jgi:hypothetical protein
MRNTLIGGSVLAALLCVTSVGTSSASAPLVQSTADPQGRFTITFPADWQVATRSTGMIAVLAVGPMKPGTRATVNVVVEALPSPLSPASYAAHAERLEAVTFHHYAVIQQGEAAVAGRPAYYRYITWEPNVGPALYQIQVFFTLGQTGFVVTGSTVNEAERIRGDVPVIVQIIDTFRITTS